jgi:hypothetical protein
MSYSSKGGRSSYCKPRPCTERREFLRLSAAATASVTWSCTRSSQSASPTLLASAGNGSVGAADARKVLLVLFSRAGENYFNGGRKVLKVGNTEVVADFIREGSTCPFHGTRHGPSRSARKARKARGS